MKSPGQPDAQAGFCNGGNDPSDDLLEVDELYVSLRAGTSGKPFVRGVSFRLRRGRTLAIVGESGSGKSLTARAVMRLLPGHGMQSTARRMRYHSRADGWVDLLALRRGEARLRQLHAQEMALVFQQSLNCLNPVLSVGWQIEERLVARGDWHERKQRRAEVVRLLENLGINPGERMARLFPHQLSGGMRQRVMLAMALAGRPGLLIADEATTALDATVQRQVLAQLRAARNRFNLGLILITHDLGLVIDQADEVLVFREGEVVESGPVETVFSSPGHPYTQHLIETRIMLTGEDQNIRPVVKVADYE